MLLEVLIAVTTVFGTATISLIGWTARELYRTSQNQTELEQRVGRNENKIEDIFQDL